MTIETFRRNWEPDLDGYARFNFSLDLKELIEQIRADAIEEVFSKIDKLTVYYAGDKEGNAITPKMLVKEDVIKLLEQLKENYENN